MKFGFLDKAGVGGAIIAAAACPLCFPLLAVAGSALGLGILAPFEGIIVYVFQGLVLLALSGNVMVYTVHKNRTLLISSIFSAMTTLVGFYTNEMLVYVGLLGLVGTAILNQFEKRKCQSCQS